VANNPIKFTGISFGNLVAETTYYILVVRGDGITFTVSSSPGGSAVSLSTAVGLMTARTCPAAVTLSTDSGSLMDGTTSSTKLLLSTSFGTMNAIFSTPTFGGIEQGTTYYIKTITPGMTNSIQISESSGGSVKTLTTGTGSMLFGEVGWDHLNPGTPILPAINDSTSIYFIEPRLTFSSPTFSQSPTTLISAGMGINYSGIAYGENFWLAIPATGTQVYGSSNGTNWLTYVLPTTSADWTSVAYGHGTWVVISGIARKVIYSSSNATSWKTSTLPTTLGSWASVSYGLGNFVAVSLGSSDAAYSLNSGDSWVLTALPSSADWTDLAYGNGIFVTIANGTTKAAYSTDRGETWTASTLPGSNSDWTSIAYGNGRFVAVSGTSRSPAYSFDGIEWNVSPYSITATSIEYGNGVFVAVNSGSTTAWTSEDGLFWKKRTVTSEAYIQMAFGFTDTDYSGRFITVAGSSTGSVITAGSRTKGRLTVDTGIITSVSLWETGSNYDSAPTISLFDPNVTTTASISARIGDGVLSAPTFFSTGQGYNTSSTTITINGNGYSDSFQTGLSIVVKDLSRLPRAGDNLTITGDDTIYKVTNATILNGSSPPTLDAVVEISPAMSVVLSPDHDTSLIIREKYSQVRLTGHDFLNIGFGDQYESGYPAQVPRLGSLQSQDQVIENNFGRVFYTSTDQDGNFKVGSLFGVEQATGIVTLSASQFGLTGLEQLSLGGIAVGGSSVVIQQFSTDATFIANSDTIIPTQRAVKSYLSGRLSQGGANTITGVATAGTVIVGGPNVIGSTVPVGVPDSNVTMENMVNFTANNGMNQADGGMMAFDFFMKNSTKKSI
jgi:hypothetical protein